jgi:hypothetical protein
MIDIFEIADTIVAGFSPVAKNPSLIAVAIEGQSF